MCLSTSKNGLTFGLELLEACPDLVADERRQPFGRFVQDQQLRVRHQAASDGQHLLLAAGEFIAHVAASFGENGKHLVDVFEPPARWAETSGCGRNQILLDAERRKDLTAFGHEAEAGLGYAVRRQTVEAARRRT